MCDHQILNHYGSKRPEDPWWPLTHFGTEKAALDRHKTNRTEWKKPGARQDGHDAHS